PGGTSGYIASLGTYAGGLYATGTFTLTAPQTSHGIARWDGSAWSGVGGGVSGAPSGHSPGVYGQLVYDDGQGGGPQLYVYGTFLPAGTVPASNIGRWDGAAWSAVGSGVDGMVTSAAPVTEAGVTRLYAFDHDYQRFVRWDGVAWTVAPTPPFP